LRTGLAVGGKELPFRPAPSSSNGRLVEVEPTRDPTPPIGLPWRSVKRNLTTSSSRGEHTRSKMARASGSSASQLTRAVSWPRSIDGAIHVGADGRSASQATGIAGGRRPGGQLRDIGSALERDLRQLALLLDLEFTLIERALQ
jgi:hypothetical protein